MTFMTFTTTTQASVTPTWIWTSSAGSKATPNQRTANKIRSFGALPDGWHYGSGAASPPWIVRKALNYLFRFMMMGFDETDAFVSDGGQIMVTAYKGDHCIEVTIEVDRTLTVAHQINGSDVFYSPEMPEFEANTELWRLVGGIEKEKCDTFGSSISEITTAGRVSLGASLSTFPAAGTALQFSTNYVESLVAAVSAPMRIGFTKELEESLRSSGHSTLPIWNHPAV
jgi:hypothetical protein